MVKRLSFSFWVIFLKQYKKWFENSIPWFLYLVLEPDYYNQNLWAKDDHHGWHERRNRETSNKEIGPSSIKFLMLNSSNYTVWATRMRITLSKLIKFGKQLIYIFGIRANYWNQNLWAKDTTKNTWHIPSCNGVNNTDYENHCTQFLSVKTIFTRFFCFHTWFWLGFW